MGMYCFDCQVIVTEHLLKYYWLHYFVTNPLRSQPRKSTSTLN